MTGHSTPTTQPRSQDGRWKKKTFNAPETGALNEPRVPDDTEENRLKIHRARALNRHESAFLYSCLGEPGDDAFESFERLGELAAEEAVMSATVEEWSQLGK